MAAYRKSRVAEDAKVSLSARDKVTAAEVLLDRARSVVELALQRAWDRQGTTPLEEVIAAALSN